MSITISPPRNEQGSTVELTDIIKCECEEVANTSFELSAAYPITGGQYNLIKEGAIITGAADMLGNVKNFMIKEISRPIGGVVTIHAYQEMYEALNGICRGGTAESSGNTATEICNYLYMESGHAYNVFGAATFETDIDDSITNEFKYDKPKTLKSVVYDAASLFGGIWEFNNRNAKLWAHRGQDRGFSAEYGLNITNLTVTTSYMDRYTHVCPYWIGKTMSGSRSINRTVYLDNMYVSIYGTTEPYTLPYLYDCSKVFDTEPSQSDLAAEAQKFILDPANNEKLGKNSKTITLDYVALKKTAEYINDPNWQASDDIVAIGDTITITDRSGIEHRMVVVGVRFDMLRKVCKAVTLGYPFMAAAQTRRLMRSNSASGGAVTGVGQNTSYTIARLMKKSDTDIDDTSTRPDSLTYVDSDQSYTPPSPIQTGETFDTITETFGADSYVYGVGVLNKGQNNETVTRLIYPDKTYTTLTGW